VKIILLQLPIQSHDFFFSNENIPLAPAYLQAIARQKGIDAHLLPNELMSYGSDQSILRFLVDARPDLVGMSCYQWNVERSLFLAEQLKASLPTCTIVMGGPEITPENRFLRGHRIFDIGVVGEGEAVWEQILQSFPDIPRFPGMLLPGAGGGWNDEQRRLPPSLLGQWPSPFLSGFLDFHVKQVLWLETVRGCNHRCSYCYYHKQLPRVRPFPLDRVRLELERARSHGFSEAVFLDPCFARHPHLEQLLDRLAEINRDGQLHFHAECNAEDITPGIAKEMGQAGFEQLEVGLQTTKASTLKSAHRRFFPGKFLQGVRSLQECGLKVMVDIIAGLPGDTLSDICASLDWIMEKEAYDFLMLYPLSVLPGTELYERSGKLGLRSMPYPPYLLTRVPGITAAEINQAFHYYEDRMEEDVSHLEMPAALNPWFQEAAPPRDLCHVVHWDKLEQVVDPSASKCEFTYALTARIGWPALREPDRCVSVLKRYLSENPFTLLSVEVPYDVFPEDLLPLWSLAEEHNHPADRDFTVTHTPYRSFLVMSRAKDLVWKWPDPRESFPVQLHDGQQVPCHPVCLVTSPEKDPPPWWLEHLAKRYPKMPDIRQWTPPDDADH
jgi:radical SAM superfamily enzyme YgiQ (UPF0313 family)